MALRARRADADDEREAASTVGRSEAADKLTRDDCGATAAAALSAALGAERRAREVDIVTRGGREEIK